MTHTWPELRRLCRERQVELVEVDLRWGIAEEQSTRRETLKLCLDEIRACRPFFIGLLGERYGWVPEDEAFTADLREEQPWLEQFRDRSITELEILHGVLNNPDMAPRAFFYFRNPDYARRHGADFLSDTPESADRQTALKDHIRAICAAKKISLQENYSDPRTVAALALEQLSAAISAQFPLDDVPDALSRAARDHEAFAKTLRRTYIGRSNYFTTLDCHAADDGGPLVLLGQSGSGKSALLANWTQEWHKRHPQDVIIQHYIGSTPDSTDHWRLMTRIIREIKRWTDDPEDIPRSHDILLRQFPFWLAKARRKAKQDGVRCIVVLDAFNQLEDHDGARLLGWLPAHLFDGPLRLLATTLPGESLDAIQARGWATLRIEPLTPDERRHMTVHYLFRFGKTLDTTLLTRLIDAPATATPLYLKILLDELRVTGTHDRLGERLEEYLSAADIPALLRQVLARYTRDYERDRPGLVGEVLGLIWVARRGLTEAELLRLLRPADQLQIPQAIWSPLRAALEESLLDYGGILNFAHEYLHTAVEESFVRNDTLRDHYRLQLALFFMDEPVTPRSCDELPWLLWKIGERDDLRNCLLQINRFRLIQERNEIELYIYWTWLGDECAMGAAYRTSFDTWAAQPGLAETDIAKVANDLAFFLNTAALYTDAEPLMRRTLAIDEQNYGAHDPLVAKDLNNLAGLLHCTNRLVEAESLYRRALEIETAVLGEKHPRIAISLNNLGWLLKEVNQWQKAESLLQHALAINQESLGAEHPMTAITLGNLAELLRETNRLCEAEDLHRRARAILEGWVGAEHPDVATSLNNLALVLIATNRLEEAEPLMRRALAIDEMCYGQFHPTVADDLTNLSVLLHDTNRREDAEQLRRRALAIDEQRYGLHHPRVARDVNNLAELLREADRCAEAEPLYERAFSIWQETYGINHPYVATVLRNMALLMQNTNRCGQAEALQRRALAIDVAIYGDDHPDVATDLNNLAQVLRATNRRGEAEILMRRALDIDEHVYGPSHPVVAMDLNNLAMLLTAAHRGQEAEPLMRRHFSILLDFTHRTGHMHPLLNDAVSNYSRMLTQMGFTTQEVIERFNAIGKSFGIHFDE